MEEFELGCILKSRVKSRDGSESDDESDTTGDSGVDVGWNQLNAVGEAGDALSILRGDGAEESV